MCLSFEDQQLSALNYMIRSFPYIESCYSRQVDMDLGYLTTLNFTGFMLLNCGMILNDEFERM